MSKKCEYFFVAWTEEKGYGIYSNVHKWTSITNKRNVYWNGNRITKERYWKTILGFLIAS